MGEWLMELESGAAEAAYLWPRTPVGNLQAECWRRVGASDWNMEHPNCRAGNIVDTLRELADNGLLRRRFTVLDLCCGDGVVLLQIGRAFLEAKCYGVDLLSYPTHRLAERRGGVAFYKAPLQAVIDSKPPAIVDVCLMLNTFRGWDKADLPVEDSNLPQRTLRWMRDHCRYLFLTIHQPQEDWLRREGLFFWPVGRGEDASRLVCAFPCEGPEGPSGMWRIE